MSARTAAASAAAQIEVRAQMRSLERSRCWPTALLLAALCVTVVAQAERPWLDRAAEVTFVRVETVALPERLRKALRTSDEFTRGRDELPVSLDVARVDLNGDGMDAYVVRSPQPYSGGPMMFVLEQGEFASMSVGGGRGATPDAAEALVPYGPADPLAHLVTNLPAATVTRVGTRKAKSHEPRVRDRVRHVL